MRLQHNTKKQYSNRFDHIGAFCHAKCYTSKRQLPIIATKLAFSAGISDPIRCKWCKWENGVLLKWVQLTDCSFTHASILHCCIEEMVLHKVQSFEPKSGKKRFWISTFITVIEMHEPNQSMWGFWLLMPCVTQHNTARPTTLNQQLTCIRGSVQ